jgi:hypothetical protein
MRHNIEDIGIDRQYFAEHGFAFLKACQELKSTVDPAVIRPVINFVGHSIFGQTGRMPSLWDRGTGGSTLPLILVRIYRHLRFGEPLSFADEHFRAWCKPPVFDRR